MKLLLTMLLFFWQTGHEPEAWQCPDTETPSSEKLVRVSPAKLKARIVACVVPRLPPIVDVRATIAVEIIIDEQGGVVCERVLSGINQPLVRRAALDAAKEWRFEPLKAADGEARPYVSILFLDVSWDAAESGKRCPKEKRRA